MITTIDRETSVLLDGEWQIAFDPKNRGISEGWHRLGSAPKGAAPIQIPACWEEIRPGYDGVAWFWRTFSARRRHAEDRVALVFDAVNYYAEVWVDGHFACLNEGGYTPFSLDVSEWIQDDADHALTVRVLAPPRGEEGLDGFVLKETPCWRAWESYNFGGIWQSVRLLNLPPVYIEDCFVEPTPELNAAIVHPTLAGRGEEGPVTVECSLHKWGASGVELARVRYEFDTIREANSGGIRVPIEQPELWTPDSPNLYRLELRLKCGHGGRTVDDKAAVRFGLRWFDFRDNRFHLNGEPVFVKGGFHEGLYPIGLPKPPSRDFVRQEIRKAKQCGFNLLRFWQIPIHPWVLDAADELGMMLCNEPPIEWMTQTDRTAERCRNEVERLVRRDRNRPSVVMWTILNEGGITPDYNRRNFGGFTPHEWETAPVQRERDGLCRLARSLDPTRLIVDDSGGWVVGANTYGPGSDRKTRINDCHVYRRAPTSEADLNWLYTVGSRSEKPGHLTVEAGAGVFMSEFGYGSFPDFERILERYEEHGAKPDLEDVAHHRALLDSLRAGFEANGMGRFFPDVKALCEATQVNHAEGNALQTLALRANPLMAGYVMHAFSAGGCILGAELFDTWREAKLTATHVAEAQKGRVLAVFVERRAVEPGDPVKVKVVSVNDGKPSHVPPCELTAHVVSPAGETRSVALGKIDLHDRIQTIWQGDLSLGVRAGEYALTFDLRTGERVLATGGRKAFVVAPLRIPGDWTLCALGPGWESFEETLKSLGARCVRSPAKATHLIVPASRQAPGMAFGYRELAANGRTLLVLAPSAEGIQWTMNCFDIGGEIAGAAGNWSPVCHYIEEPDLRTHLPSNTILGQAYADILPTQCIRTAEGRALASCFSYQAGHIFTKQTEVWWGKTILEKPFGNGRVIVCTYRVDERIQQDLVARNLLVNLLEFSRFGGMGHMRPGESARRNRQER